MTSDEEITKELKQLTAGLLFMSESDYPFEAIYWKELPEISSVFLRSLTGLTEDAPVEIISVNDFFRAAAAEESWKSPESLEAAAKYRKLVEFIKENLDDAKAYRVGSVNIAAYIVGQNKTGNWLGVSTRVVET